MWRIRHTDIASWEDKVKRDLNQLTWMHQENVAIPEMASSYPAAEIWREMASYARDTGEDDWLHDLARIKIIMDDNELRAATPRSNIRERNRHFCGKDRPCPEPG
ncbi:hypothetical protein ACHAPV_004783 [Trichoderma viride]